MKDSSQILTEGPIYKSLVHFAVPVILSLFLQSLYGAVDLIVVGRFSTTADVSAVATGSHLLQTITLMIIGFSTGITVLIGQQIGKGNKREAGKAIGAGIFIFIIFAILLSVVIIPLTPSITKLLRSPLESFAKTVSYIRICSLGLIFITAYNILGSIFRGIGDSETPLKTVTISCILNIAGDLFFVAVLGMGASGAALATIGSQAISVLTSYFFIRRKTLPVEFRKSDIRFEKDSVSKEIKLGLPIGMQELLVGLSFLVINSVVNSLGLVASAGMGVADKVIAFIMLIPSAFAQSMTSFVAQNFGAGKNDRSVKALKYGILTSICFGVVLFYVSFFHGNILASLFDNDISVINAAHSYLKAYAIDCMLTPILFCMIGFFNGYGKTTFVMLQGIISAFCIRTPLAIFFGHLQNSSLFIIGLSTPCSTTVQIAACIIMFYLTGSGTRHKIVSEL